MNNKDLVSQLVCEVANGVATAAECNLDARGKFAVDCAATELVSAIDSVLDGISADVEIGDVINQLIESINGWVIESVNQWVNDEH